MMRSPTWIVGTIASDGTRNILTFGPSTTRPTTRRDQHRAEQCESLESEHRGARVVTVPRRVSPRSQASARWSPARATRTGSASRSRETPAGTRRSRADHVDDHERIHERANEIGGEGFVADLTDWEQARGWPRPPDRSTCSSTTRGWPDGRSARRTSRSSSFRRSAGALDRHQPCTPRSACARSARARDGRARWGRIVNVSSVTGPVRRARVLGRLRRGEGRRRRAHARPGAGAGARA